MNSAIGSSAQGVPPSRRWSVARLAGLGVPLVGIALSVAGALAARQWQVERAAADFAVASEGQIGEFRRELDAQTEVLYSVAALYDSSKVVERAEFATFVRRAMDRHQSIRALVWVEPVAGPGRAAFEAAARAEGIGDFRVTEPGPDGIPVPAPDRYEYLATRYAAAHDGDTALLGFNQAGDSARAEALARARAKGGVAVSAPVRISTTPDDPEGVVAFVPVYAPARTGAGEAAKAQAPLLGYVGAALSVGAMLTEALDDVPASGLTIRIIDESSAADKTLAQFESRPPSGATTEPDWLLSELEPHTSAFDVGGRRWRAICTPLPGFFVPRPWWGPWGVLVSGLTISALVSLNIWTSVSRRRVQHLVDEQTADLRRINSDMGAQLEDRQREVERRNQLIRAMDERVKQSLAAVVSMVENTADNSVSLKDFSEKFRARIGAMSRLHSSLAESRWEGTDLGTLVRQTLGPYAADAPGRVVVRGEALLLPADAVSGVSMALHELATNAANFGALAVPEGRVEVAGRASRAPTGPRSCVWSGPRAAGRPGRETRPCTTRRAGRADRRWTSPGTPTWNSLKAASAANWWCNWERRCSTPERGRALDQVGISRLTSNRRNAHATAPTSPSPIPDSATQQARYVAGTEPVTAHAAAPTPATTPPPMPSSTSRESAMRIRRPLNCIDAWPGPNRRVGITRNVKFSSPITSTATGVIPSAHITNTSGATSMNAATPPATTHPRSVITSTGVASSAIATAPDEIGSVLIQSRWSRSPRKSNRSICGSMISIITMPGRSPASVLSCPVPIFPVILEMKNP